MIEFLRKFFAPERSSETAKERLKLVLLSDHLSLAPDVVAALKRDLLEVISRYVEIDPVHADVTFEQRDREVAMLASIPITGMRERVPAVVPVAQVAEAPAADVVVDEVVVTGAAPAVAVEPAASVDAEPVAIPLIEHEVEPVAASPLRRKVATESGAAQSGASATPPVRRRKRRRKVAATNVPRGAPAHGTPGFD